MFVLFCASFCLFVCFVCLVVCLLVWLIGLKCLKELVAVCWPCPAMVRGVVWLVGRRPFRFRSSDQLVFSKHVLHELRSVIRRHGVVEADVAERLAGSDKHEHWHDALSGMSCTILGVALIEGMQADAFLTQRTECEQEQEERRVYKCRL